MVAPDLRGIGGSTRATNGYDALNLAADLLGLLDALDVESATVVAIDAGVPPAFLPIGAEPVGDALARQLEPVADDLRRERSSGRGRRSGG